MKDTASPDQDPGGPVPLVHKSLSDIAGVGLGSHYRDSQLRASQVHDPASYLRNPLGLPNSTLHHPFHLAALSTPVYPPSILGANFPPAALMASLSARNNPVSRGRPPLPPSFVHSSRTTLTNLHATLAAGDASHHAELLALLKDSAHQQELLLALSKLSPSTAPPSSSTSSTSSTSSSRAPLTSSSFHLPHFRSSPPPQSSRQPHMEVSPKQQLERASSLSPSSYLTPRSLNGSPSASFAAGTSTPTFPGTGTPTFTPRLMSLSNFSTPENLSPTSPPTGEDGSNSSNMSPPSGMTPTRKSSSTPRPERVFTCKLCDRSFGYKHVLQNHERTHTGEKPFECKECHKRFTRDHHLKTHMRLHTGEKPYHCSHCDRQFVQVANLRRHLRVHTGERPYTCEMCSSRFSDSNQLKAHVLIHKGEKPFECVRCRCKFRRRHHLIHHKCTKDLDGDRGTLLQDPLLSYGAASYFNDGDVFNCGREPLCPSEEIDEDDLVDEGVASPGTPIPPAMTVIPDEEGPMLPEKRRERKNKEPRRLVANPSPDPRSPDPDSDRISHPNFPPTPLPEQTEPEDLSMGGARRRRETPHRYRANIALTTSTGCSRYSLQYPSPIEDHSRVMNEGQSLMDTYEIKDAESIPSKS